MPALIGLRAGLFARTLRCVDRRIAPHRQDQVPKEQPEKSKGNFVEMDVPINGETNMLQEEAASLMDAFWGHAYTE